jgi:hypothetical protein
MCYNVCQETYAVQLPVKSKFFFSSKDNQNNCNKLLNQIEIIKFSYLVFKIKNDILNQNCRNSLYCILEIENIEQAHKKAVEILSPTDNELLFLKAIIFDPKSNLYQLIDDLKQKILMNSYVFVNFELFKNTIL